MKKEFYRFRSIEKLIGFCQELEDQAIYFSPPELLNDPMEGYRNFFWMGDSIVWKNFFCHYLLCLERIYYLLLISEPGYEISENDIPIFNDINDSPTEEHRELLINTKKQFLENHYLSRLITKISEKKNPVRREELLLIFTYVNPFALEIISKEHEKKVFFSTMNSENKPIRSIFENDLFVKTQELFTQYDLNEGCINDFFKCINNICNQLSLLDQYSKQIDANLKNKNFIFYEFPKRYLSAIEKLVFPKWYTACFMSQCENSSVWGHYGDNHSGACLIFNSSLNSSEHCLNLKNKAGDDFGVPYKFHPVNYVQGFGQIDFFRMLGCLPIRKLYSMWYELDKEISICAEGIIKSEDKLLQNYWESFYRDIIIKSQDWQYENEYRLILSRPLECLSEKEDRTLFYDFRSLNGIIFGINTKTDDKISIMKIIEKKCKFHNRNDFKFYQADYSQDKKCITYTQLGLLKFSNKG